MAKIIQNHNECIGCGACVAVCPKFWEMIEGEFRARPKNGKLEKGKYVLEVNLNKEDLDCNKTAEESCPVQIIKVET